MQKLPPAIRSAAAYAPSEAVDGRSHPSPVKSSLEGAGRVEDNKHLLCQIYGKPCSEQSHKHLPCVIVQLTILHNMDADYVVDCRQDYGWLIR